MRRKTAHSQRYHALYLQSTAGRYFMRHIRMVGMAFFISRVVVYILGSSTYCVVLVPMENDCYVWWTILACAWLLARDGRLRKPCGIRCGKLQRFCLPLVAACLFGGSPVRSIPSRTPRHGESMGSSPSRVLGRQLVASASVSLTKLETCRLGSRIQNVSASAALSRRLLPRAPTGLGKPHRAGHNPGGDVRSLVRRRL